MHAASSHGSASLATSPISQHATLPSPFVSPVPSLSVSPGSSSTSSPHSLPRSEIWDNQLGLTSPFDFTFDNFSLDPQVNPAFGDEMFGSFLEQPFDPCSGSIICGTNSGVWLDPEGNGMWPAFGDEPQFTFSPAHVDHVFPNFDPLTGTVPSVDLSPSFSADQTSLLDSILSASSPTFDVPVVPISPQRSLSMDSNHYRTHPCHLSQVKHSRNPQFISSLPSSASRSHSSIRRLGRWRTNHRCSSARCKHVELYLSKLPQQQGS